MKDAELRTCSSLHLPLPTGDSTSTRWRPQRMQSTRSSCTSTTSRGHGPPDVATSHRRQIDGIWHTSIVAWDREYFFGQGISVTYPVLPTMDHLLRLSTSALHRIDRETFEAPCFPTYVSASVHKTTTCSLELQQFHPGGRSDPDRRRYTRTHSIAAARLSQHSIRTDAAPADRCHVPSARCRSHAPTASSANGLGNNLLDQVASRAYAGNTPIENGIPSKNLRPTRSTMSRPLHSSTRSCQSSPVSPCSSHPRHAHHAGSSNPHCRSSSSPPCRRVQGRQPQEDRVRAS